MAAPAPSSLALKEYLKRYQSGTDEPNKAKKKKKKNKEVPKPLSTGAGVIVVDKDPVWQKPVQPDDLDEEDDFAGDETPQVEEDIEVKRMKRLEALRSRKPYHSVGEDGSVWVSIPMPSRASAAAPHRSMEMDEKPVDSGRDTSPPRRRQRRLDTPSPEPRLSGFEGEVGDLSPPRRRRVEDLSPPRRAKSHRQEEEAGRGLRDDDLSPPRRTRKRSPDDLSPPRRARKRSLESADVQSSSIPGIKESLLTKEVKSGGLLSGKEMREETDRKRMEEKSRFAAMDPLLTGRGAEPVYRDKKGKRISKEELMKSKEEKKEKKKKKEEKPLEWGKGLAQKREAEERGKELELEKERPFARSRDDPELDKMLKERLRWGDPISHLVKRKTSELILEDLGENEKMKESGFIVPQTIPSYSWLKRGLDFPPNRYGIKPGRHWDGVDRSNGYEKELFQRQNEKRATETEAYLWSVSDM